MKPLTFDDLARLYDELGAIPKPKTKIKMSKVTLDKLLDEIPEKTAGKPKYYNGCHLMGYRVEIDNTMEFGKAKLE